MALKSVSFLMFFALLAFTSLFGVSTAFGSRKTLAPAPTPTPGTDTKPLPGDLGFTPMDSNDPKVIELATFAIGEYNKANNAKLVFTHVLEAISTTKEQATTNYELAILATDNKDLNSYFANISVVNGVMTVTSFSEGH